MDLMSGSADVMSITMSGCCGQPGRVIRGARRRRARSSVVPPRHASAAGTPAATSVRARHRPGGRHGRHLLRRPGPRRGPTGRPRTRWTAASTPSGPPPAAPDAPGDRPPTVARQNGRTAERQNGRTAERQNGRTAERQNGRTAERQNGGTWDRRRHDASGTHVTERRPRPDRPGRHQAREPQCRGRRPGPVKGLRLRRQALHRPGRQGRPERPAAGEPRPAGVHGGHEH